MSAIQGYRVETIREGDGPKCEKGQHVTVHCTGWVLNPDGSESHRFWSTSDTNEPFSFTLSNAEAGVPCEVIAAWDLGVLEMRVGEVANVTADSDHCYGDGGFPAWNIPPAAALRFQIEVLSVN